AVHFLFVVMMLDVDFAELRQGLLQYAPVGVLIGIVFLLELLLVAGTWVISPEVAASGGMPFPLDPISNTRALGQVIYTRYVYLFEAAGIVLLVAMIGAIVLTLRHREGIKRQDATRQVGRRREDSVAVVKVESGKGI
ncbi:MAG: NADH-quinone oxidoreductase subunit J, partial [Cucumibacter sp.]